MSGRLQVGLLVALLLGSALVRHGLLFLLALALLLVAGTTWLWERACLTNVEHRRRFSQRRAFFGEEIELTIEIVNRKALPLAWLNVEDNIPSDLAPLQGWVTPTYTTGRATLTNLLALRWHERVRRRYRIRCLTRGEHVFGPARLRSGDLFGFTSREMTVPDLDRLLIYPRVVPIASLGLPSRDPFGDRAVRQWLFQDPLRVVGVRDYVPGDSLRRVNWAATARTQRLQVKLFEPTTTYDLALFLNLNTSGAAWWWQGYLPDLVEMTISTTASLGQWAIEHGYQVGLYANGKGRLSEGRLRVVPGRGPDQLTHLLEALARVLPFATLPLDQLLRVELPTLPYGATVVVVTAVLGDDIMAGLLALRAARHQVALILIGDHPADLALPGVQVRRVTDPAAWRKIDALALGGAHG